MLDDLELFIENNLNQNGIKLYYIGRTTRSGERVIYFVTNDKDGANGLMNFLKQNELQKLSLNKVLKEGKKSIQASRYKRDTMSVGLTERRGERGPDGRKHLSVLSRCARDCLLSSSRKKVRPVRPCFAEAATRRQCEDKSRKLAAGN